MKILNKSILMALIVAGIFGITGATVNAQNLPKSAATVIDHPVQKGTSVALQLPVYRGALQWQQSANGTTWTDWEGKTEAQITFTANEESFVRAAVTEGKCDPVYTETVHVVILTGPVVITTEVTRIAATEAYSGGKVTDNGGKTVTAWGLCWSTHENPTINDSKLVDVDMSPDEYISYITGLTPDATYYVRAFATTSEGTGYGNQFSFKTQKATGSFIDSRDSREYHWVYIGSQKWMSENLAWLPSVSPAVTGSKTEKIYYVYGYDGTNTAEAIQTENYTKYGALYNWPAAMNGAATSNAIPSGVKGACPDGWHLPSRMEWMMLRQYLSDFGYAYGGTGFDIGKSLASTSGWDPSSVPGQVGNDQATNNSSGFNGLPGGGRDFSNGGIWVGLNGYSFWWVTTEYDTPTSYCTGLYSVFDYLRVFEPYDKSAGFSIRCVSND